MRLLRFMGEGLLGVALSVLFTAGVFPFLPFVGLFAWGAFGAPALIGLFFLWAFFLLPSLIVGIVFLRREAKVFGWTMILTGAVVSLWIQLAALSGGL